MRVLLSASVIALTLCLAPLCDVAHASLPTSGDLQLSTTFTVDSATQIPGKTLKPGTYSITVLDHLADRTVLRVDNEKGKAESTFLALPNAHLASSGASGPIMWSKGPHKTEALRGFSFTGNTVEFVYAKEDAVAIAKVNTDKVLAIDPVSEGRPVSSKLSEEDRRMVTLWTLASTRVGPENNSQPAIEAARYQPAPVPVQSIPQTTVASNAGFERPTPQQSSFTSQRRPSANMQVASLKRPAVINALPHTASALPLIWLVGFTALLCAVGLRMTRGIFS